MSRWTIWTVTILPLFHSGVKWKTLFAKLDVVARVVEKIRWGKDFTALKSYKSTDPCRHPDDTYDQELEVLDDLRELWGTHVPKLLFHKPAYKVPVIGLQLGEPMEDDFACWSQEELKMMEETVEKVKQCGYEQIDHRGANFVCLVNNGKIYIAMIDFEEMKRVV